MVTDGLNPLMISQIARKISFNIIGPAKINPTLILMPKVSTKFHDKINATAMKSQTDIHRGMSFDW